MVDVIKESSVCDKSSHRSTQRLGSNPNPTPDFTYTGRQWLALFSGCTPLLLWVVEPRLTSGYHTNQWLPKHPVVNSPAQVLKLKPMATLHGRPQGTTCFSLTKSQWCDGVHFNSELHQFKTLAYAFATACQLCDLMCCSKCIQFLLNRQQCTAQIYTDGIMP